MEELAVQPALRGAARFADRRSNQGRQIVPSELHTWTWAWPPSRDRVCADTLAASSYAHLAARGGRSSYVHDSSYFK